MPKLPNISGNDCCKILARMGFEESRQRGSHLIMKRDSSGCVVPMHKEIKTGTLRGILKQAGVSPEDFLKEYNK
ncbi:MAG: type II toxin-antitoxin system HicA family toxin [Akkermansiaceae bacterium]|jgi:predicted RNA binding protein YcfA (HicA-like mRNA interferase family)|nr:type II toxin-antitoxin system HicA family toxin [Akkermansiaceae bacterium]MDP4647355.1 type II toxin-antitoxin system HicA family toxin [Akkermansiaceae bacterium]MDP4720132.1 type II toxin-antitoxin system HicA family toxin [Akkermansiaceae bacterium]MDP4779507.1 type II toxin-antitoxin system HicA family toxin [Akkermansiaceae bacterium]MDP4847325.1 type II toxin-antitoxin system HicA family toxin [Akkermansiaceae bacterium]